MAQIFVLESILSHNRASMATATPESAGKKKRRNVKKKEGEVLTVDKRKEEQEEDKGNGVFVFFDGKAKYGESSTRDLRLTSKVTDGEWERFEGVIKKHGRGIWEEGDNQYSGDWKDDKMHGFGTFRYQSGAIYEGEWTDNKYEGKGKYKFPDGSSYEGAFRENKMHGFGSFTDRTGLEFKGQFYNNLGPGLITWQS
ncbi:hypothetical protein PROFUN_05188 [Planoprotostelium fungivorum]|uniref:Uncharacterized protein n=1 Tax=Planoprotostelium fungivorum TaxID=1890364 RepID=A0A2P6NRK8_9EUKA|nr:hypothetical protein PROFUN_05188 [Planoprotostelium fungivorum]